MEQNNKQPKGIHDTKLKDNKLVDNAFSQSTYYEPKLPVLHELIYGEPGAVLDQLINNEKKYQVLEDFIISQINLRDIGINNDSKADDKSQSKNDSYYLKAKFCKKALTLIGIGINIISEESQQVDFCGNLIYTKIVIEGYHTFLGKKQVVAFSDTRDPYLAQDMGKIKNVRDINLSSIKSLTLTRCISELFEMYFPFDIDDHIYNTVVNRHNEKYGGNTKYIIEEEADQSKKFKDNKKDNKIKIDYNLLRNELSGVISAISQKTGRPENDVVKLVTLHQDDDHNYVPAFGEISKIPDQTIKHYLRVASNALKSPELDFSCIESIDIDKQ